MKKQALLAAVLLATGVSFAQAADASTSVQTYFNGYATTTQPQAAANQAKPSVEKSLAIGISTILANGPRLAASVSTDTPNVANSLVRYTSQFKS
jgi:opacity protein-like surface antigen